MTKLPEDFDPSEYLRLHKDVAAAGVDPVQHYLTYGATEGREYKPGSVAASIDFYQSFSATGASDSKGKLEALKLDRLPNRAKGDAPLSGKSVLDIGCNEGYFCIEAKRLGATRVLGIDKSKKWIELARKRSPDLEFINTDWWNIPDERFDVIFFLSSVHYEQDQKKLFDKLARHLTQDGVLVLECGVISDPNTARWATIPRGIGDKPRYPTKKLLEDGLLASFATRMVGRSVQQQGDPVSRFVFHCQRKRSTVVIVSGIPQQGKSVLTGYFADRGTPKYSTDEFLRRAIKDERVLGKAVCQQLGEADLKVQKNLSELAKFILSKDLTEIVCDALLQELPVELPYLLLEGEFLRHPEVAEIIEGGLISKGVRVWNLSKVN